MYDIQSTQALLSHKAETNVWQWQSTQALLSHKAETNV